jgi:hypothetical protein
MYTHRRKNKKKPCGTGQNGGETGPYASTSAVADENEFGSTCWALQFGGCQTKPYRERKTTFSFLYSADALRHLKGCVHYNTNTSRPSDLLVQTFCISLKF